MSDLISRQAATEALKRAEALTGAFGYHVVIDTIRELPSAQPDVPDTNVGDMISRQAAIDKLKSIITDMEYTSITDEAKERIARKFFADIPSSVQPEIIRCKDCKYHAEFSSKCNKLNLTPMWPNDYCSYGERAEA